MVAKKYCVIRRDALRHVRSGDTPASPPENVESFLGELVDTFDWLETDKVHYLDESPGGVTDHLLTARNPNSLLRAVTCGSPLAFWNERFNTPGGRSSSMMGFS